MRHKVGVLVVAALIAAGGACFDFGSLDESPDAGVDGASDVGACTSFQKSCVGKCYEQSDPSVGCSGDCTACVAPRNAQAACALQAGSEVCSLGACNPQYGDCDTDPGSGCETHTTTRDHCGSCGVDCLQEFCERQGGGYACSATCDAPNVTCPSDGGPECADLQTDNEHCGRCDVSCAVSNGSGTCNDGTCDISCNAGYFSCNGACSLPSQASCGGTCAPCPSGNICDLNAGSPTYGQCVATGGTLNCLINQCKAPDGGCVTVDMTTSPNCGGCGVDCKSVGKQCCTSGGKSSCTPFVVSTDAGTSEGGSSDASTGSDAGAATCKP